MSRWPFRKIYLYLVCLISVLFILFGIFSAIDHFVNAVYPAHYGPSPSDIYLSRVQDENRELPEEIIKAQERYYEEQLVNNQRRDLAHGAGRLASVLFVAFPMFWFHWRQTRPDD